MTILSCKLPNETQQPFGVGCAMQGERLCQRGAGRFGIAGSQMCDRLRQQILSRPLDPEQTGEVHAAAPTGGAAVGAGGAVRTAVHQDSR